MVLDKENINLLKQTGIVLWLNAPLQDIIDRLNRDARNAAIRPQFTAGNIAQETIEMMNYVGSIGYILLVIANLEIYTKSAFI